MFVAKDRPTVYFDVDDTLLLWGGDYEINGLPFPAVAHDEHVTLLRSLKAVGYTVVVWSAGGSAWAERVVQQLGLAECVDVIVSKPSLWIDDYKDPARILEHTRHRYIGTPPAMFGTREEK